MSRAAAEHEAERADVHAALERVRRALGDLRGATDIDDLGRRATRALCHSGGFRRAMISRLEDGHVVVWSVCIPANPGLESSIVSFADITRPVVDASLVEADMVRRRRPILVADVAGEPRVHREFVGFLQTPGYVAAPVVHDDRTIGFLHADLVGAGRAPDELDRARLGVFAEGLGYAMERVHLLEELRDVRCALRRTLTSLDHVLGRHGVGAVDRGREAFPRGAAAEAGVTPPTALTGREREVLELLAEGLSNADIGRRLVISPGTAKSHVSHILRKLGANNRAEAVSQYLRG